MINEFLPRELFNEPLVDDGVRNQAEMDVITCLDRALDQVCNGVKITYQDATFHGLIELVKGIKKLQHEVSERVGA